MGLSKGMCCQNSCPVHPARSTFWIGAAFASRAEVDVTIGLDAEVVKGITDCVTVGITLGDAGRVSLLAEAPTLVVLTAAGDDVGSVGGESALCERNTSFRSIASVSQSLIHSIHGVCGRLPRLLALTTSIVCICGRWFLIILTAV